MLIGSYSFFERTCVYLKTDYGAKWATDCPRLVDRAAWKASRSRSAELRFNVFVSLFENASQPGIKEITRFMKEELEAVVKEAVGPHL